MKEREEWLALLEERYGFEASLFDGYEFARPGKRHVHLVLERDDWPSDELLDCSGMALISAAMKWPKPTTAAVFRFARHATRNLIDLDRDRAERYVLGTDLELSSEDFATCTSPGWVLLRWREFGLGLGQWNGETTIANRFPKRWRVNRR